MPAHAVRDVYSGSILISPTFNLLSVYAAMFMMPSRRLGRAMDDSSAMVGVSTRSVGTG